VPGYEILGELGRGGMGVVYKARQTGLGRLVALKVILHAEHAGSEARGRFRTEAHSVARLQHPNIVGIHDFGEVGGLPFFSLEFCAGGSLDHRLAQQGPLDPHDAARLVLPLALAIQAAHEKHVVHRDLKPANVLLTDEGIPKITDFGLAKQLDEVGQTASGAIMGSPSYMAPEQARGKTREMGPHTDIYALGAILYECLTGRPPFREDTVVDTIMAVVAQPLTPPRQIRPDLPLEIEAICLKCLEKAPRDRPASARELAEALEAFLGGQPLSNRWALPATTAAPILVSYRPSESAALSARLCRRLAVEFGRENVKSDLEDATEVSRCRAVLVVIGPSWLTAADEPDGVPRLYDSRDPVRKEVEAALGANRLVIPVLVNGATLPDPQRLPESLRPLCRQTAVEVKDGDGFDADADRLVGEVQLRLAGGPARATAASLPPRKSDEVIGRDRAFRLLAERVVKGANLVVLCGPAGSGKTVTALEFARMHLPPERHRDIIRIDARKEFYELSLADAAGKRYPDEFYVDGDGSSTSRLPFRSLKHRAVELLARHKAVVILDGPGEATYPRDGEAELNLARQTAGELAARGVLTVVTTRESDCWAGQDPIPLQGLSPENSRALLEQEFLRRAPAGDVKTLSSHLGGEGELTALLGRGTPGELISAARRAAESQAGGPKARASGGGTRLVQLARRGAEQLLGDPITPRSGRSGEQSSGLGLIITCMVLLLVAGTALVASYGTGSARWERMFYRMAATEDQVPPLGGSGKAGGLGPGLLVELARVFFIVGGLLMIVVGRFFARELGQLVPAAPWAALGPRQLNLRSVFRLMYAGLMVGLIFSTLAHHYHIGPRILWMCNGNPFLQRYIDASDVAATRELQGLPDDDPHKMNGEPPSPGDPRYSEYWWDCVFPYWLYCPYSFVMFVLAAPVVLTVCLYAVCANLWTHLITQPRTIADLPDDTRPDEVESRLRYYKLTYVEDLDRSLVLLLTLLSGWVFHEWLDRDNLTERGKEHTIEITLFAVIAWAVMFGILLLAYQPLYREATKRIPDGRLQDEFRANHQPFRFFSGAITGSFYFWLSLAAGAVGLISTVVRVSGR
jgi:serine/threonine protein kinase